MKRNKKKTYIAVLGVCATGLIVDRVFLAESVTDPQLALGIVDSDNNPDMEPTASAILGIEEIPELPFPFSVQRFTGTSQGVDPFQLPGTSTGGAQEDGNTNRRGSGNEDQAYDKDTFMATYRLNAVVRQGETAVAVFDDRWVRIGELVSGCRLKQIEGRTAVFECFDGEAELKFGHGSE